MRNITEHDSEHEREGDQSEQSWVGFLIARNSVSVDDLLGGSSEIVGFKVGGGSNTLIKGGFCDLTVMLVLVLSVEVFEDFGDQKNLFFWDPTMTLEHCTILFKHIHGMVDGFFFGDSHLQLLNQGVFDSILAWGSK